ncbi:hypothetical protein [Flavobacterium notoginsengisoli]
MKRAFFLFVLAIQSACTPSPSYKVKIETTYNFNPSAANLIMRSDTVSADYKSVEKADSIFVYDQGSKFIFKVSKKPSQIQIMDQNEELVKWTEKRGYKIKTRKDADTLKVEFFPTASTPSSVFKFGMEYKFY